MDRNPPDMLKFSLALMGALFLASSAPAAPRSISDCESIKQADDYNRCLAAFGPAAHVGPAAGETPEKSGEAAVVPPNADKGMSRSSRRGRHAKGASRRYSGHGARRYETRHNGRVRASFSVKDK